jgi:hypothetical protein
MDGKGRRPGAELRAYIMGTMPAASAVWPRDVRGCLIVTESVQVEALEA